VNFHLQNLHKVKGEKPDTNRFNATRQQFSLAVVVLSGQSPWVEAALLYTGLALLWTSR
jgi:hypothetical protein